MAVLFPDIEIELVSQLTAMLAARSEAVAQDVRVATIKAAPSQPAQKQVIVTGSYQGTNEPMLRTATAVLDIWAPTYAEASELGLLVAALIPTCAGHPIKRCVVSLGPVRLSEQSQEERRSMTIDLTVKGEDI